MNIEELKTKKITKTTFKSFIKKNSDNLYAMNNSRFDGMSDMVEQNEEAAFRKVEAFDAPNQDYTLGIHEVWIVGQSRDYFRFYEDEEFYGIKCFNACGSFVVALKKEQSKAAEEVKEETILDSVDPETFQDFIGFVKRNEIAINQPSDLKAALDLWLETSEKTYRMLVNRDGTLTEAAKNYSDYLYGSNQKSETEKDKVETILRRVS